MSTHLNYRATSPGAFAETLQYHIRKYGAGVSEVIISQLAPEWLQSEVERVRETTMLDFVIIRSAKVLPNDFWLPVEVEV